MKELGNYWYELRYINDGWLYTIYDKDQKTVVVKCKQLFETQVRATFAAVGHISLLEEGILDD